MPQDDIPPSTAWDTPPTVPAIAKTRAEILAGPFTLHEAAYLVANADEWERYMIVGREAGHIEVLLTAAREGTRWQMRRELEAKFWERIKQHVVDAEWRAVRVEQQAARPLSRFEITAVANPFIIEMAAQLSRQPAPHQMVFEEVDRAPVSSERKRREDDAVEYLVTWKDGRPERMPVVEIEAAIAAKFKQYNFGPRALTRIRKRAGLKQKRGLIADD